MMPMVTSVFGAMVSRGESMALAVGEGGWVSLERARAVPARCAGHQWPSSRHVVGINILWRSAAGPSREEESRALPGRSSWRPGR
ncbi:MAG: hypothetical protein P8R54_02755 [Myxococcota bacterium]|nr:hypothetical protein [Myxococcota bacterium]